MIYTSTVAITLDLHEGEFALSKDLNVALWIQYRTCIEETSLREVCGGSFNL